MGTAGQKRALTLTKLFYTLPRTVCSASARISGECACCALEDALGSHGLLEGLTAACWSLARLRLYFLALPLVAFFAVLFLAAKTRGPQRQCLRAAGHL